MIKIEKDITKVPNSIQLPFNEFFPVRIPSPSETTHARRKELIKRGSYIDEPRYNDRYKQSDTKEALRNIYKNKCAFCEQKIEQSHVDHYRPKSKYHWLAYSWDNLLLACATCNGYKLDNFEIVGNHATFSNTPRSLKRIHCSSGEYDLLEKPKMINPEVNDPFNKIKFQRSGLIESVDVRFKYTILKCKIDRDYLNDERRKIIDIFQRDIKIAIYRNTELEAQKVAVEGIIAKFIDDSLDEELPFLGFRRFATNNWLKELIVEVKGE